MLGDSRVVVIGGIKRSGSTWQYNLVRVTLLEMGHTVGVHGGLRNLGKYSGDYDDLIIKSHFHSDQAEAAADLVFTSYRPVPEVRKSLKRFGRRPPTEEEIDKLVSHFQRWNAIADYRMDYDDLVNDPLKVTTAVLRVLDASALDPLKILNKVSALKPPTSERQDPVTLYFSNHVTSDGDPN